MYTIHSFYLAGGAEDSLLDSLSGETEDSLYLRQPYQVYSFYWTNNSKNGGARSK